VMTSVIAVQGLLFQDGGLLVMGANIFNMGLLTAIIGFGLYRSVASRSKGVRLTVAGVAAWLSTVTAALVASLQLWLSGTSQLQIVLPAMLGVHVLIGLGEAAITVAALAFIEQTRPDLLNEKAVMDKGGRGWVFGGVLVSLLAVLFSPLASTSPDGLNRVAKNMGFLQLGHSAPFKLLANYAIPFLGKTPVSTIVSGAVGVLVVLGWMFVLGRILRRKAE